ncbi:MAG: sodium:solute symporter family protein [Puniceicoccales bacterium]|jgi:SSS family solute:Na+ symporter|nr:sodium:solute symporter family protein [Puniceicoccales bacterium]
MTPLLAASQIELHFLDYAIMGIYVLFVLGIGFALKRHMKNSSDFLTSGRSIPAWVTGLAFISANLGALEVIGMAASGAKYGMLTTHFYWIGAIVGMVFLAIFMMPFYYGSKARSAPEYLKMRFDEKTRGLNSLSFAVMTVLGSGISMHALADLLSNLLGWNYDLCLVVGSVVVMLYIFKGGLTSAIYTEVVQFFLIVFGFAPVVYLGLKEVGGWEGLTAKLHFVGEHSQSLGLADKDLGPNAWTSIWSNMGDASANSMGANWIGLVFGLGFVLAFSYWCANFLVVQRAMAANSMRAARNTPIIATIPKMIFPLLVIVPGLIAVALESTNSGKGDYQIYRKEVVVSAEAWKQIEPVLKNAPDRKAAAAAVVKTVLVPKKGELTEQPFNTVLVGNIADDFKAGKITGEAALTALNNAGVRDYNNVITSLLYRYCPTGLLGLALTALLASFMSGMAGNVTAFNTVWTYDIYQSYFAKNKSDGHYMLVGKAATIVGIILSIGFAYVAKRFDNIMDLLQLVFGFVNAPIFAAFLLGMFWKRATGHAAFFGAFIGTIVSALFYALTTVQDGGAWLINSTTGLSSLYVFPSAMTQNFWLAISSFGTAAIVILLFSLSTKRTKSDEELRGLVYSLTPKQSDPDAPWYAKPLISGIIILLVCLALNLYFA